MRLLGSVAFAALLLPASVRGEDYGRTPAGPALSDDSLLLGLVKDAVENRPEVGQVRAQIAAERERAPQSHVLPDPTLSLGIQNDGFGGIQIGKMESSWLYVVAAQTFPWPGKRGMRGDLAGLEAQIAEADLRRTLLTVAADVERAYLDLLLVSDQLGLLGKLESLWKQSEEVALARYQVGEAAQSDVLRAQLERNRLKQRRWAIESEARRKGAALNRLCGRPLDVAITANRTLADLPDPIVPNFEQARVWSEAESPELRKAQLVGQQADRRVDLARKERWPDLTVSAGVMPRWGNFGTMWQAGVAFNVPVWSLDKQSHVMAENHARGLAARGGAEALRQLLALRVRERLEALGALVEANRLYRSGLLVQSETTVSSTLLQYQVGRVSFASVMEALSGYLSDVNGFLDSIAAVHRITIAQREVSLDAPVGTGGAAITTASIPGAGATSAGSSSVRSSGQQTGADSAGPSMSRM
jgi:outer membrane protein, heavy metal efflux system